MDNRIEVSARTVFGTTRLDPVNPQAHRLAALMGTKTLTLVVLSQAQSMGFEIVITGDTRALNEARDYLGGR